MKDKKTSREAMNKGSVTFNSFKVVGKKDEPITKIQGTYKEGNKEYLFEYNAEFESGQGGVSFYTKWKNVTPKNKTKAEADIFDLYADNENIYAPFHFIEGDEHDKGGSMEKGGAISGILTTTYTNPLDYLKAMGAKVYSDLNFSTEDGIDYYVGQKGSKSIVVSFIVPDEEESKYLITKEDAREMANTAKIKGTETVEFYTDYGIELHSTLEKPKDIGFDKIYKVNINNSMERGGQIEKVKELMRKKNVNSDDVSPNFVNDFANEHGITNLTSEQVVKISDTYSSDNSMERGGEVGGIDVDEVVRHFIIAGLWASYDDNEENLDRNYGIEDVSSKSVKEIKEKTIKFLNENIDILKKLKMSEESIGHDLFLDSQGHGAGFWDRGYGEDGNKLSKSAKKIFPSDQPYVGDDNKIYFYFSGGSIGKGGEALPHKLHWITYYELPNGKWEVPQDSLYGVKYAIFDSENDARSYIAKETKGIGSMEKGGETKERKSFDEQYEEDRPLRAKASKEYYSNKPKFKTIQQARKEGAKYGNWICKVKLPDGETFYTATNFQHQWVKSGNVFGMWNELTLVEKVGGSMEKGGEIDSRFRNSLILSIASNRKLSREELQSYSDDELIEEYVKLPVNLQKGGSMEKGGGVKSEGFKAYTILESNEYGHRGKDVKDKNSMKFYIEWYGNSWELSHYQKNRWDNYAVFKNEDELKKAIDKVRYSSPTNINYGLTPDTKFNKEYLPISEKFNYASGGSMERGGIIGFLNTKLSFKELFD